MSLTPGDLATTGKAPAGKAFPGDEDLEGAPVVAAVDRSCSSPA